MTRDGVLPDMPTSASAQIPTPIDTNIANGSSTGTPTAEPAHNPPPEHQTPGHSGFRRQRASRACEICHSRKVRCDAASLGVPCTNCVAFKTECRIPSPKRNKKPGSKSNDRERYHNRPSRDISILSSSLTSSSEHGESDPPGHSPTTVVNTPTSTTLPSRPDSLNRGRSTGYPHSPDGMPATDPPKGPNQDAAYTQYMKPKFARAPIKEAGRVAYLGESSNLSLLVRDTHGAQDVVHYPLPETSNEPGGARVKELDDLETNILRERGAFLLPPRQLCDELVEDFFTWIAPVVPVINRTRFMRQYRDPNDPPSLLLLQAILLAGSRVCKNPQLMDANGSTIPAALTFYSRTKALYESNYEDDRVTLVQALTLMAWHWDSSVEDVTKNVFYWSRVAIIVAQGSGMHRSVEKSQLCRQDKRLWKRIWWTLFTRDRSVAVALGRPVGINIEDTDVEMLTEDDFIDEDTDGPSEYPPNQTHVQFFLTYVKLCEIMGLVLSQNYSVGPQKNNRIKAIDLTHCDMALADWLQNCPKEVFWDRRGHHFWSALLHANYYTTLCLLHRAHMPPAGATETVKAGNGVVRENAYPSRNIAFQAAGMITSIMEALMQYNQLRFTPAFIVYSLFSALLMHVYQMRSSNSEVVEVTRQRLILCMHAMKEVSKTWNVAKAVYTLFDSILGNKNLEEKLQKAAGKRHEKGKGQAAQVKQVPQRVRPAKEPTVHKRKLDEFDTSLPGGQPAANMSFERSQPVSPANTPMRDPYKTTSATKNANVGAATATPAAAVMDRSQQIHGSSPMGASANEAFIPPQGQTGQASPFPFYNFPDTPPDLFLHTRNSPNISQDLWQNYQPDQLFPADGSAFSVNMASPGQDVGITSQTGKPLSYGLQGDTDMRLRPGIDAAIPGNCVPLGAMPSQQAWDLMQAVGAPSMGQLGAEDALSNSSGGTIAPSTLNVGDWLEFFGIQNSNAEAVFQAMTSQ